MRREAEVLNAHNLTPAQFNVLRVLRGAGTEGRIWREIGERMLAYDPDVRKLLDRLEGRGLVTRARRPSDRRAIVACITPDGLRTLKAVDKPLLDLVVGLLGHLGEKKLKTLSTLLEATREKAQVFFVWPEAHNAASCRLGPGGCQCQLRAGRDGYAVSDGAWRLSAPTGNRPLLYAAGNLLTSGRVGQVLVIRAQPTRRWDDSSGARSPC